jgi:serine/threonine-protein kinase
LPIERLVQSASIDYHPEVSPNGRYIAYQSSESGRDEIHVRPFPGVNDGWWRVSTDGGANPAWAKNGQELYYVDPLFALMAVPVDTSGPKFSFGNPSKRFETSAQEPYQPRDYDVAPDGRFLIVKTTKTDQKSPGIVVVLNWFEELKSKVR